MIKLAPYDRDSTSFTMPCVTGCAGGGTIDGNGTKWWRCALYPEEAPCYGGGRPSALFFPYNGTGVRMYNISIMNSPFWK